MLVSVYWQLTSGASGEQARTVAVNVFVAVQIAYLLNCRSLDRLLLVTGVRHNPWLLVGIATTAVLQLAFTYAPWMNALFGTAPLGWTAWAAVIAIAIACWLLVELEKWWRRTASPRLRSTAGRSPGSRTVRFSE